MKAFLIAKSIVTIGVILLISVYNDPLTSIVISYILIDLILTQRRLYKTIECIKDQNSIIRMLIDPTSKD